uniref:Uncharacterized protein n=1 Tax=Oryza punctata TaxID=4537 RepID=A0A0E0L9E3_ORYPU
MVTTWGWRGRLDAASPSATPPCTPLAVGAPLAVSHRALCGGRERRQRPRLAPAFSGGSGGSSSCGRIWRGRVDGERRWWEREEREAAAVAGEGQEGGGSGARSPSATMPRVPLAVRREREAATGETGCGRVDPAPASGRRRATGREGEIHDERWREREAIRKREGESGNQSDCAKNEERTQEESSQKKKKKKKKKKNTRRVRRLITRGGCGDVHDGNIDTAKKEDSEKGGKQGKGRRKVLTLWQPCSGTPRVADDIGSINGTAAYPSLCSTEAQPKPATSEQTERRAPVRCKGKRIGRARGVTMGKGALLPSGLVLPTGIKDPPSLVPVGVANRD